MLVLRRSTSEFVPEWDRDKFWNAYQDDLYVGSIVEAMGPSGEPPHWNWSVIIHCPGFRATDGRATTRETAMAAFRKAFDGWINRVGDEGWAHHVEHMRLLKARSGPNLSPAAPGCWNRHEG